MSIWESAKHDVESLVVWWTLKLTWGNLGGNWAAKPNSSHPVECRPAWLQYELSEGEAKYVKNNAQGDSRRREIQGWFLFKYCVNVKVCTFQIHWKYKFWSTTCHTLSTELFQTTEAPWKNLQFKISYLQLRVVIMDQIFCTFTLQ